MAIYKIGVVEKVVTERNKTFVVEAESDEQATKLVYAYVRNECSNSLEDLYDREESYSNLELDQYEEVGSGELEGDFEYVNCQMEELIQKLDEQQEQE